MLNEVILEGRTTRDPYIAKNSKYGFLNLAVDRDRKDKDGNRNTDFIDVMFCGDKVVELYKKYVKKGDPLIVKGSLQSKSTGEGEDKKTSLSVVTYEIHFPITNSKKEDKGSKEQKNSEKETKDTESAEDTNPVEDDDSDIGDDDDDLPFWEIIKWKRNVQ